MKRTDSARKVRLRLPWSEAALQTEGLLHWRTAESAPPRSLSPRCGSFSGTARALPYHQICRLLHVSEHTVKAIERSQATTIAVRPVSIPVVSRARSNTMVRGKRCHRSRWNQQIWSEFYEGRLMIPSSSGRNRQPALRPRVPARNRTRLRRARLRSRVGAGLYRRSRTCSTARR